MSTFNPNVRRQRRWVANVRRHLHRLSAVKAGPHRSDADGEVDRLRKALESGPPPLRPEAAEPERAGPGRRARQEKRAAAVRAMLERAGVVSVPTTEAKE